MINRKNQILIVLAIYLLVITQGCVGALRSTPLETESNKGIEMVEDKDLGKVYLAPGFNFRGYDLLLVSDCSLREETPKKDIDPEEIRIYLKNQLIKKMGETRIFPKVTGDSSIVSSGQGQPLKVLTMGCEITELDPGNRALRYLVGFGAGATKVQVETEIRDHQTRELYLKSADRRIAAFGAFGGDSKGFILSSFDQIAEALRSFVTRISSGGKIEKVETSTTSN